MYWLAETVRRRAIELSLSSCSADKAAQIPRCRIKQASHLPGAL
jgi:hypothetical protein